jgi:hypothetical protein
MAGLHIGVAAGKLYTSATLKTHRERPRGLLTLQTNRCPCYFALASDHKQSAESGLTFDRTKETKMRPKIAPGKTILSERPNVRRPNDRMEGLVDLGDAVLSF